MSSRRDVLRTAAAGALGTVALGATANAATEARKPNILILMCDQERYPQWTPKLPLPAREWIDERGVSFDRFVHSAVPCSPSRSTFWTGMYVPQTGIFGNFLQGYQYSMDPSIPTIGDLMREQGYTTAYFGKWHLSFSGVSALDGEGPVENAKGNYLGAYGFDYSAQSLSSEPFIYSDGLFNDPLWTGQAVDWIKHHGAQAEPWVMVVSLLNPHDISYYPRGYTADVKRPDYDVALPLNFQDDHTTKPRVQQQYHNGSTLITGPIGPKDEAAWRRLMNIYCDLTVMTDEMLSAVVGAVDDAGVLEDTVIMRTADHGELAGSHGLKGKGPTMYEEQIRMPLTIAYPKRFKPGGRTAALSEAVDLVPTCLELAGVAQPNDRYPWLRGRSLVSVLEDPASSRPKEAALCTCDENWSATEQFGIGKPWKKHMRAVLTDRFKFARYMAITGGVGRPPVEHVDDQDFELYDLRDDPYELRNLAIDKAYAPLVSELRAWLAELERERLAKIDVPRYGAEGLPLPVQLGRPDIPGAENLPTDPAQVTSGGPGGYIQLPIEYPQVTQVLYGGGRELKGRERARLVREAHRRQRALMLCELMPEGHAR